MYCPDLCFWNLEEMYISLAVHTVNWSQAVGLGGIALDRIVDIDVYNLMLKQILIMFIRCFPVWYAITIMRSKTIVFY